MTIAEDDIDNLESPPKVHGLKKYFREKFTKGDSVEGKRYQVLDVAPLSKHEIYLAVEECSGSSGGTASSAAERRVFARLCLVAVQAEDGRVTKYRTEDEHEPPSLANCPLRILNLLTPSLEENALQWRLRCYEKQIEDARSMYDKTKERYGAIHFDQFRHFGRQSAEMMIERRFLILHQALSAEQITRALLKQQQQR